LDTPTLSARSEATNTPAAAQGTRTAMALEQFNQLAQLIHEGALKPAAWREFLALITQCLQGNCAALILRVPQLGEIPLKVTFGGSPESEGHYFKHYLAVDPFVQLPDGRAVTLHDFVNPVELEASDYFRDWLQPIDAVYALGVDLRDRGRYHVRLRICRPRRAGNFSPEDCRLLEMFVPHLRTAIQVFSELDIVRSERSVYAEAMDQLTLATLVLDEHGKVLHANRLAESILGECDGMRMSNGSLQLDNHADSKRFRELLTHAIEAQRTSKQGIVEVMRVRRKSGRPDIGVVVRPSSSQVDKRTERLTTSIAVFLSVETPESSQEPAVPSEVIQKLFGLTPKEATLALRLAAGESLLEASERLGIKPNTARTHLRSIFTKTGVDRQAKLVRALLRSVAMLGQESVP